MRREGRGELFVDGEEQAAHSFLDGLVYSADGARLAWRAGDPAKKDRERWTVVVDGRAGPKLDWAGAPAFAPDGQRVAYWGAKGVELDPDTGFYRGGDYRVHFGREKGPEFADGSAFAPPTVRPDGKELAYTARDARGHWIVVGKERHSPYLYASRPAYGPDGRHVVWAAVDDELQGRVHLGDERIGAAYDAVGSPRLGPNGAPLAFKARRGGEAFVVVDGKPVANGYALVGTPVLAPSGERFAFIARRGGSDGGYASSFPLLPDDEERRVYARPPDGGDPGTWLLVVDGEELVEADELGTPVFSPEGAHVACALRRGGAWHVLLDGRELGPFDAVATLSFTGDGAALGIGARIGRELWWKVAGAL